ncbi:MYXO-CTERM sorting domain-containing protein [Parahaliea aestuarii]|uniref:PEP-CTERM sorting domain-containing protein n=1 Tax=Parahaliea aestuarii TaxID=1852021 RepID=A0A5C9A190_9GAMM|nr:MYXO-CTERM sorting domain-containing protein [Parahaliea aestuarii]TXS94625.1 hypothetical protein FVW59_01535 [Parahaliea aestuarii]
MTLKFVRSLICRTGHLPAACLVLLAASAASNTFASPMTCESSSGSFTREWSFDSAEACGTGKGNPNSSADIEGLGGVFDLPGSGVWTKRGDVTDNGDDSDWLNVSLTSGNWGDKDIEATWTLAAGFWDTFGLGVFTVHVGHGPTDNLSDFGAFMITPGEYNGTWQFSQTGAQGGGGGLSNAGIWTTGVPIDPREQPIPNPGVPALMALGLLLMARQLRRRRRMPG